MSLPTVSSKNINVLITGLGPFGQWRHNAGWSAISPLHNTYLDPWSPPLSEGQPAIPGDPPTLHGTDDLPRIHIQTLQIPMHYPAVLDIIPRLHGHEPASPYANPWLDPKGAQDRFAGDGRAYPAGYSVRHPIDGWDVILHVGVGSAGKMTVETRARKAGYKGRDTDGNFPPPLPQNRDDSSVASSSASSSTSSSVLSRASSMRFSDRQRSLWSVSSDTSSLSRTTQGSTSPELGCSPAAGLEPPSLSLPASQSNGSERQLRKRVLPSWMKKEIKPVLPRVGDKADLEQQLRPPDDVESELTETQRARKRLRSYKKFLERHPRGMAFERPFLEKRPAGGFDEGYEEFGDVEDADIDTDLLVEWLTQMSYQNVFESQDGGGWLCEFILYCSLCESRRPNPFLGRASQVIDGSTWGEQAAQGAKVLFIHCPPVGEPLSVKEIRAAVRATVWWFKARESNTTLAISRTIVRARPSQGQILGTADALAGEAPYVGIMPADDFSDDDMFDGITEEDLQLAEFQASQQLQRIPPKAQTSARPSAAPQNPYQRHIQQAQGRAVAAPKTAAAAGTYKENGRAPMPSVVPAKRPAPAAEAQRHAPRRASPGLGIGSLQPALGRLPGTKRVQPPFKPPFKKPKTEPMPNQVPPPLPPPLPQRGGANDHKRGTFNDPIDDIDDDDEFWANVDVEAEELIATQQVRSGPAARSEYSASPEKQQPAPVKTSAHAPQPDRMRSRVEDEESRRIAAEEAAAREKAEEEAQKLKKQLQELQMQLWTKQGEDKMLRQRLQKAEADKSSLEKEKERMRVAHQEEVRKVNSQKDEDMKRMHDIAQFRAMEAETSRRTPQWPMRRPGSVHRSGSQFRTPQIVGLKTPTKSAEKRKQANDRILSQDSPTRRANANAMTKPLPPVFPGFDNSFIVPALPRNKGKAPAAAPTSSMRREQVIVPETPKQVESMAFDDYAFEPLADALSSPARASRMQTPKTSPRRANAAEPIAPHVTAAPATTPAAWKLWARQVYAVRCSNFVGDILSFGGPLPTPVSSLPRSQLLSARVEPAPTIPAHPLVIHRLIDLRIPEEAHPQVKHLWDRAMERLLEVCSDAGRNLTESFFVHPNPESAESSSNVVDEAERIFWSYQEQIDEAMLHVLQSLAALLRILACILMRLCMLDAVQDVLLLLSRMMLTSRNFVHAVLLPESPLRQLAMTLDDFSDEKTSQDFRIVALLQPPLFPKMLIEIVRKTYAAPLRTSHQPSAPAPKVPQVVGKGKGKQRSSDEGEEDEVWDMGDASREECLAAVASCLQCLSLSDPQARSGLITFIEEPGMVMTYIHPKSSPDLQEAMLQILLPFAAAQYEWMNVLACDFPADLPGYSKPMRDRMTTPLVDVLGKELGDGHRDWSWEDNHRLHCSAIIFFSQLLIYNGDSARTFLGDSKQLLAAVIRTIHRDSTAMWLQADLVDKTDDQELGRAADRICMNLQFLCLLCVTPTSPIDLAARMRDFEARSELFKGLRQLFNVSFGRISCIASPDYLNQPERDDFVAVRSKLDQAYALANDILDRVLSPDEVIQLYQQMGAIVEEPEDGADDETQTQDEEDMPDMA
ncbi:hypothetical protein CF319_g1726 [Tilletia indica]|nr:hypothetical protein CF319_g1726 [Tilletia indica]